MNPATGREHEVQLTDRTTSPRTVLVVGGGPAGLESARVAALRGHRVLLAEAAAELGGRLRFASRTYEPNADVLRWLRTQVDKAGVDVRLGVHVDAAYVRASGADAVVVAVGGDWARPEIPGVDLPHVRTVDELEPWLLHGAPLGASQLVVVGGGRAGLGLADLASRQGAQVTVVEAGAVFAPQVGLVGRWRLVHELRERGLQLLSGTTVERIEEGTVRVRTGDATSDLPAELVAVVSRIEPRPSLVDELRAAGIEVHAVGDCTGAGFIEGAMQDAAALAVAL